VIRKVERKLEDARDRFATMRVFGIGEKKIIEDRISTLEELRKKLIKTRASVDLKDAPDKWRTLDALTQNVQQSLEEARQASESFDQGQQLSLLERQQEKVSELRRRVKMLSGVEAQRLAQTRQTKEELKRQAEALRNVNRILLRRNQGIQAQQVMPAGPGSLGEMPSVLQSIQERIQELSDRPNVFKQYAQQLKEAKIRAQGLSEVLQDVELAGSARELGLAPQGSGAKGSGATGTPGLEAISMSLSEIQEEFDVSRRKAKQFKREAKSQVGQIVSAVGSLGSALVTVFQDGEKSAQEFASVALSAIGGVISAIPGVGQVAGPLFSAAGRVVGSFEHGGEPEPGLAKVHPPELMVMNGEERIIGREETKAILRGASGDMRSEALAQKIQENTRAIKNLQLTADSSGIHLASQDFQSELERTGARMYPAP
jgi:flagellar hook-basal body complex protein FliE